MSYIEELGTAAKKAETLMTSVSTKQKNDALKTNKGEEKVAAGGASVGDDVIQGSMNYYVDGVTQVN